MVMQKNSMLLIRLTVFTAQKLELYKTIEFLSENIETTNFYQLSTIADKIRDLNANRGIFQVW